MKVQLEKIDLAENQPTPAQGEVVAYDVTLTVNDGPPRRFQVFVTVNVVPGVHIGLLNGDHLLETLLRFEAETLAGLLKTVGRFRRGLPVELPMLILDAREEAA